MAHEFKKQYYRTITQTTRMMPTFLGQHFYNGGFPVPAQKIIINCNEMQESIEEIKIKYYEQRATEKEMEALKEYVLYYVGAPVFKVEFDNLAQEEFFKAKMPLDDMLDLLLDAGIDPL